MKKGRKIPGFSLFLVFFIEKTKKKLKKKKLKKNRFDPNLRPSFLNLGILRFLKNLISKNSLIYKKS